MTEVLLDLSGADCVMFGMVAIDSNIMRRQEEWSIYGLSNERLNIVIWSIALIKGQYENPNS